MNNSFEKIELIDDFKDYQIDWLLSHFDIEFEEKIEDTVIQFIKDTAQCYINETLYKDSEKIEKIVNNVPSVWEEENNTSLKYESYTNTKSQDEFLYVDVKRYISDWE